MWFLLKKFFSSYPVNQLVGDTDEAVADQPETYAGKFFINANSDKQPIVFTRDKIKMDQFDIEEEIYSG